MAACHSHWWYLNLRVRHQLQLLSTGIHKLRSSEASGSTLGLQASTGDCLTHPACRVVLDTNAAWKEQGLLHWQGSIRIFDAVVKILMHRCQIQQNAQWRASENCPVCSWPLVEAGGGRGMLRLTTSDCPSELTSGQLYLSTLVLVKNCTAMCSSQTQQSLKMQFAPLFPVCINVKQTAQNGVGGILSVSFFLAKLPTGKTVFDSSLLNFWQV